MENNTANKDSYTNMILFE